MHRGGGAHCGPSIKGRVSKSVRPWHPLLAARTGGLQVRPARGAAAHDLAPPLHTPSPRHTPRGPFQACASSRGHRCSRSAPVQDRRAHGSNAGQHARCRAAEHRRAGQPTRPLESQRAAPEHDACHHRGRRPLAVRRRRAAQVRRTHRGVRFCSRGQGAGRHGGRAPAHRFALPAG